MATANVYYGSRTGYQIITLESWHVTTQTVLRKSVTFDEPYVVIEELKMSTLQRCSVFLGWRVQTQWLERRLFCMGVQSPINELKLGGLFFERMVLIGGSIF